MFGFSKKKSSFDDAHKTTFIEAISGMLELQKQFAGTEHPIEDSAGNINRRAVGYIYGFIDAALQGVGQNMSDVSIGIPITHGVLRRLYSGHEERYVRFLIENTKDPVVTLAKQIGGQQYIDYSLGKLTAPMGLARCLIEGEHPK